MIDEPLRPGLYVKNLKEPYRGLCIVLEVDGQKVRTYSERGPYDVLTTLTQLAEVSPEDSIFPGTAERLRRAFEQARQSSLPRHSLLNRIQRKRWRAVHTAAG